MTGDYEAVRAHAQERANRLGMDHGIERNRLMGYYRAFLLPRRQSRCGHELRCEVVYPTSLESCKPGHGPMAGRS